MNICCEQVNNRKIELNRRAVNYETVSEGYANRLMTQTTLNNFKFLIINKLMNDVKSLSGSVKI